MILKHALYLYQQQTTTQLHNIMANLIQRNGETMKINGTAQEVADYFNAQPNTKVKESRAYSNGYSVWALDKMIGTLLFDGEVELKPW